MENKGLVVVAPNEESSGIPVVSPRIRACQNNLKPSKSVRELAKKFECKETPSSRSAVFNPSQCGEPREGKNLKLKSFIGNNSRSPIGTALEIEGKSQNKLYLDFPVSSSSPISSTHHATTASQNLEIIHLKGSMIGKDRKSITDTASDLDKSPTHIENVDSLPETRKVIVSNPATESVLIEKIPVQSVIKKNTKAESENISPHVTLTAKTVKIPTSHLPLGASNSVPNLSCFSDNKSIFSNYISHKSQPTVVEDEKSPKCDKYPKIKVTEESILDMETENSDSLSPQESSEFVSRSNSLVSSQIDLLLGETSLCKGTADQRSASFSILSNIDETESDVPTAAVRRTVKTPKLTLSNPQAESKAENRNSVATDSPQLLTESCARNTKSRIFSPSMRPLSSIFMTSSKSASNFVRSFTNNCTSKIDPANSLNDLQNLTDIHKSSENNKNNKKAQESNNFTGLGILQKGKSFFRGPFARRTSKGHSKMFGIIMQESPPKNSSEVSPTNDQETSQLESKRGSLSGISSGDLSNDSLILDNNTKSILSFTDKRKNQLQKLDSNAKKEHKKRLTRVKNVVATLFTEKKFEKLQENALEGLVMELISIGFFNFDDRDDIYFELISMIQKMRSTKEKNKCLVRGFDLLSKCACFFSCSSENSEYFIHSVEELYFSELKNREDVIRGAYVLNIFMQHLCVYYSESVKLEPALLKSTDEIVTRSSFFNTSLSKIMEMQTIKYPNHKLPWVVIELCESILMNDGRKSEGIFRLSGDSLMIDDLRKNMLIFRCPLTITDPNISASLLKSWFRDIADPMISVDLYDKCIQAHNEPETACKIVLSLPKLQRDIICYITKFVRLFMLDQFVKVTRMDYANMALVWSPNLLRSPHTDPLTISTFTSSQNLFIKNVFENVDISCIDNITIHESLDSKIKI